MADVKRLASPDQLWAIDDIDYEDVVIPEWNGLTVRVRALTAAERAKFAATTRKIRGDQAELDAKGFFAADVRLVAMTVVDDDGKRVFSEPDVAKLADKSSAAIARLAKAALRLSGMLAGQDERLEGNSGTGPSASSSSA